MNQLYQSGDVARMLGLNTQTLYYYERMGLIPPPQRTKAGYRLFSQQDVARLRFISRVKALGLSLKEVREILELRESKSLTCAAMHCCLTAKIEQLEHQIHQLQLLRDELLPLVEQCRSNLKQSTPVKECAVVQEIINEP